MLNFQFAFTKFNMYSLFMNDKKTLAYHEWQIQAAVVRELHRLGVLYHGDQNAARRGFKSAAQAKATGMRKGWPDLTVVLPHEGMPIKPTAKGNYYGIPGKIIYIEFKTLKGKLSKEQREVHQRLAECGFPVHVVYAKDGDDAWAQVRGILGFRTDVDVLEDTCQ